MQWRKMYHRIGTSIAATLVFTLVTMVTSLPSAALAARAPDDRAPLSPDSEIVHPFETDEHGVREIQPGRVRRSTGPGRQTRYYKILTSHRDMHVQLEPHVGWLAPGFRVHRRRAAAHHTHQESIETDCFYKGRLVNFKRSSVALSNCDGLMGHILIGSTMYLIEPVPQAGTRPSNSRVLLPHRLYRQHLNTALYDTPPRDNSTYTDQAFKFADGFGYSSRRKRSPAASRTNASNSLERYIETIVVVDKDMLRKHGERNVTTYVLTILNMVSTIFSDHTIGTKINISLNALILLEGDEPGLVVGHHADTALHNFCHWQSSLRGSHHDHAVLLTGVDICSYRDSPCDTLGFAPMQGMCKKYRSCTINEDTGLITAFTIAHEAGHNFGMMHDGEGNLCAESAGSIMAPTLLGNNGVLKWSSCSRKYLNKFLRSSQAWCLKNTPRQVSALRFPDKLPGELYNADIQCKWQFGVRAKMCPFDFGKDLCLYLWCYTGGVNCETKFLPAAEGTSCGYGQWCRKGVCVSYGEEGPAPVDGGWSRFSGWNRCSRTCGGGVMYRQRLCNNPSPQYGGRDCDGAPRIHRMCNMQSCPRGTPSFRTMQCQAFNNKPFRGWYYKWRAYTDIADKDTICRLYCKAEQYEIGRAHV